MKKKEIIDFFVVFKKGVIFASAKKICQAIWGYHKKQTSDLGLKTKTVN